jgi:hypothetical protein
VTTGGHPECAVQWAPPDEASGERDESQPAPRSARSKKDEQDERDADGGAQPAIGFSDVACHDLILRTIECAATPVFDAVTSRVRCGKDEVFPRSALSGKK